MKRFALCFLLLAVLAPLSFATITLRSTTLGAAVTTSDRDIYVASATGIEVGDYAFVDKETMQVREIDGTRLVVTRGVEGVVGSHASGAVIYVDDRSYFSTKDRNGPCTATSEYVLPVVNVASGKVFNCLSSLWVELGPEEPATRRNTGTANTGVTATEYGNGRHHITKLTFTGLAIGAPTEAADLGFGKLLYTLPAGAILVKSAYINVSLAGSGTTCDADTPDGGLGTVVATGAVAVLSGTATFENILTGQTFNDVNGTAEVKTVGDQVLVIESSAAHSVYLNLADGWAGACSVTGTGTVVIEWVLLS